MSGDASPLGMEHVLLTGISSVLSILGAAVLFLTYYWIPDLRRSYARRLLIFLTIADLLTATGNLVATIRYATIYEFGNKDSVNCSAPNSSSTENVGWENVCRVQSFVTTFSNLSSFLWTLVIAIYIWTIVALHAEPKENAYMTGIVNAVCWLIPIAVVSFYINELGEDFCFGTGVWCGIKSGLSKEEIARIMFIVDIAWQLFSYVTSCFLFIHVKFTRVCIRHVPLGDASSNRLRDEDENFETIWMVIYLLKLWGVVRFFITTYVSDSNQKKSGIKKLLEVTLLFQSFGASGQAFCNCVLFCLFDKTVRNFCITRLCHRTKLNEESRSLLRRSVD